MLRDFQIRSRTVWPSNRTATSRSSKGYYRSQFGEAWSAYCVDADTPAHTSGIKGLRLASVGTGDGHE
jgi:hypothetical protein